MVKKAIYKTPQNIHDNFFLSIFKKPENARDFLLYHLPQKVSDAINFSKMEIVPSTHQKADNKKIYSDLIFKTELKKDGYPTEIYFLFEHKTEANEKIFLQLLSYMTAMWREDFNAKKKRGKTRYRLIIPLVFYHGERAWNIPENFAELFDVDSVFNKHLPDFSYELFDTTRWDLNEAQKAKVSENIELFSSMLALAGMYRKNPELLKLSIEIVLSAMMPSSQKERLVGILVGYIAEGKNLDEKGINHLIEETVSKREDVMPNAVETWIQRGVERGIKQGMQQRTIDIAKQMLLEGADIQFVSRVTKLSIAEIQKIKNSLN
jgi:predicted transposase/invertase (TIGR01784 family)